MDGRINAPFGYDAELVDGKLAIKPNDDAAIIKLAFDLFSDLSDVYSKYELENAQNLALKGTTDALNSLSEASAIYARYQQSLEWQDELVGAMMEEYRQATTK